MNSISIKELVNKQDITIIDIRPNYEYQYGTIPTAINIPAIKLISNPTKYLEKNKTYYIQNIKFLILFLFYHTFIFFYTLLHILINSLKFK